jgi:O-antigen/teichoic acid export membrane protein
MLKEILVRVAKDSLTYGIGNAVTRFIQLLTLPIIARSLTPEEFGNWNLLVIVAAVLNTFMIFGLDSGIIRFFHDDKSEAYQKKLFSTGFGLMVAISIILSILYVNISSSILGIIHLKDSYTFSYYITVFWMPGMALQLYLINWFKWTFQKSKFIISTFGFAGLSLILLIVAKHYLGLSIEIVLGVAAISQWITVLMGIWLARKHFTTRLDWALLKMVIPYSIPFMVVMLIGTLRNSLDRLFLSEYAFQDKNIVGFYSMAQRLGMFMNLFVFAFDIAFNPLVFANWDKPGAKEAFARIQQYYLLAMNWVAVCLCAVAPILIKLFATDEYGGVIKILPLFFIANYLLGLYSFASIGINHSKKSYLTMLTLLGSLVALYSVNFFLTSPFRIWGVGMGLISSIVVMIAIGYYYTNKYYHIDFEWTKNSITIFFGCLLSFITVNVTLAENDWLNVLLLLIMVNLLFVVFSLLITTRADKMKMVSYVSGLMKSKSSMG